MPKSKPDQVTVKNKEDLDPERQAFNNVMEKLKATKNEMLFLNLAVILLGIVMIAIPKEFNQFIGQILGCVLCVWGVLRCIAFLRLKNEEMFGSYALVQGAAMLGFGIFFLCEANSFAVLLNHVLTLIILIAAVLKLQNAINYYKMRLKNWWLHLLGAAILLTFGIIALVKPGFVDDQDGLVILMTIIMGIALVISGVWDAISVLILSKAVKEKAKEWDEQGLLSAAPEQSRKNKIRNVVKVKDVEEVHFSDHELEEIDGLDYSDDFSEDKTTPKKKK